MFVQVSKRMKKDNSFAKMGRLTPEQLKVQRELAEEQRRKEEYQKLKEEIQKQMALEIAARKISVEQIRMTSKGETVVVLDIPRRLGETGFQPEGPIEVALLEDMKEAVESVAQHIKNKATQNERKKEMILRKLSLKVRRIDPFEIQHNVLTDEKGVPLESKEYPKYSLIDECNNARSRLRGEVSLG